LAAGPGALGGGVRGPSGRDAQPVQRPGGCQGGTNDIITEILNLNLWAEPTPFFLMMSSLSAMTCCSSEGLQVASCQCERSRVQRERLLQEEGEHLQTHVRTAQCVCVCVLTCVCVCVNLCVCVCVCVSLQDGSQFLFSASSRALQQLWVKKLQNSSEPTSSDSDDSG